MQHDPNPRVKAEFLHVIAESGDFSQRDNSGQLRRTNMPAQSDWRIFQKCQGLFFSGFAIKGVGAAGRTTPATRPGQGLRL
jgi:hypothetical protein